MKKFEFPDPESEFGPHTWKESFIFLWEAIKVDFQEYMARRKECSKCEGSGWFMKPPTRGYLPCKECKGTGQK